MTEENHQEIFDSTLGKNKRVPLDINNALKEILEEICTDMIGLNHSMCICLSTYTREEFYSIAVALTELLDKNGYNNVDSSANVIFKGDYYINATDGSIHINPI